VPAIKLDNENIGGHLTPLQCCYFTLRNKTLTTYTVISKWTKVKKTTVAFKFNAFNPLMGTLKPQSNGPLYSKTLIGIYPARPVPLSLYQM